MGFDILTVAIIGFCAVICSCLNKPECVEYQGFYCEMEPGKYVKMLLNSSQKASKKSTENLKKALEKHLKSYQKALNKLKNSYLEIFLHKARSPPPFLHHIWLVFW